MNGWGLFEGERINGTLPELLRQSAIANDIAEYMERLEEVRLAKFTISIHSATPGARLENDPPTWNIVIAKSTKGGERYEYRGECLQTLLKAYFANFASTSNLAI
jgi:hypothetical protein